MADATHVTGNSSGKREPRDLDRAIGALAARQRGIVGRRQLIELGLEADHIEYRLRCGRLHRLYRSVYAVGHDALTREARWLAAVLAGGPGAVLSHRTAAAHWSIWTGAAGLHVSVPRHRRAQPPITLHHTRIDPDEITTHEGIPTTGPSRTLFDIAPSLRPRELQRALTEAERLRLADTVTLDTLLHRYPRRLGSARIRALLNSEPQLTRSELEVLFLEFADSAGLPTPKTNQWVCGFELDVFWPEHRLAVELDSWEHHAHRAAFESDRERIRVLEAAEIRCIPVTHRHIRDTPVALERDLRKFLKCPP